MNQPSRQTLDNWESGAESFIADCTPQIRIPGQPDDEFLRRSKLTRAEAAEMLSEVNTALGTDWAAFVQLLSKAWAKRRKVKAEALGWPDEDDDEFEAGSRSAGAPDQLKLF